MKKALSPLSQHAAAWRSLPCCESTLLGTPEYLLNRLQPPDHGWGHAYPGIKSWWHVEKRRIPDRSTVHSRNRSESTFEGVPVLADDGGGRPFTADSSTFEAAHLDQSNRHLLHRRENVAASYKVHHMMMHAQAHRAHNLQWVSVIPRDRYAMRYPARRFASLSALPMPYAEMVSCPPPCVAGG